MCSDPFRTEGKKSNASDSLALNKKDSKRLRIIEHKKETLHIAMF